MSHFNSWRERIGSTYGLGEDYGIVSGLPAPREYEEDWSDVRWALEKLPHTLESERILQAYIIAENAAREYIDEHGPAPQRPEPDWLDWEDEDDDKD